jgi:hypothetical protein
MMNNYLDKFKIEGRSKVKRHADVTLPNWNGNKTTKVVSISTWQSKDRGKEWSWG